MNGSNFNPRVIQEKCRKAGIPFWDATEVIMRIKDRVKPGMTEDEIDDLIIEELRKKDENAARAYENYHRIYVRTSNGELEPFDKEKIVSSLLKETTLTQKVCEEIANEVESDIRRLELRYISAPLIRDMVNSKLLERKYTRARLEYSRLGLPLYDVHNIIENPPVTPKNPETIHKIFGDSVTSEYALTKLLPEEIAKAHLSGFIHIHDIPYFGTRITSLQNDIRWFLRNGLFIDENITVAGPPKHADTAFSHIIRILISASTHISGGQGFDFFNLFLAPYTMHLNNNQLSQLVQGFLYQLNQLLGVKGGLALASLNFELEAPSFIKKEKAILPGGVTSTDTYLDYEREAVRILNSFLDVMSEGDFLKKPFKTPRIVIKIRDGPIPNSTMNKLEEFLKENKVMIVNARSDIIKENAGIIAPNHMLLGRKGKWFETLRTGVLQEISVNMPYIGLKAKDETQFFSMLEKALNYAKEIAVIKRKIIERRMFENRILPFLTNSSNDEVYFQLDLAPSLVNLVGLDSSIQEFKGKSIVKDEDAFLFAEKVVSFVRNKLTSFQENDGVYIELANIETEKVRKRFMDLNYRNFGVKDVYYNTYINESTELIGWMKAERDLQKSSLGGNWFSVSLEKYAKQKGKDPKLKMIYDILEDAPSVFILGK